MKKRISKTVLVAFTWLLCLKHVSAQFNVRDSSRSFVMIGGTFAFQLPGGDLADRFGNNFNIGGTFQLKTRTNWIFGVDGSFIFSDQVKENQILKNISTSQGFIINDNGYYADVFLYERGFMFNVKAGKIFPLIGPNPNSGLITTLGVGILQHKILIEDKGNRSPQLSDAYKKGYDRLTNGLSLTEYLGYINFSNHRLINFTAGLEFTQAFTQNRRDFNFDTMTRDDKSRIDLLFGVRVAWIVPFYKRMPHEFYYN